MFGTCFGYVLEMFWTSFGHVWTSFFAKITISGPYVGNIPDRIFAIVLLNYFRQLYAPSFSNPHAHTKIEVGQVHQFYVPAFWPEMERRCSEVELLKNDWGCKKYFGLLKIVGDVKNILGC